MWTVEEMTLRDKFALEAMQHVTWHGNNLPQAAKACYRIADAMLAAREAQGDALDSERLDWLAAQTRNSSTGISFDWCKHTEDGRVLEKGYRFMGRAFLGPRCEDFRAAIDAARGAQGESNAE